MFIRTMCYCYFLVYVITLFVVLALFFFFNDTATTEIYTLSLHDALPISSRPAGRKTGRASPPRCRPRRDRKSTRLNSSHTVISYAVFCLKKKNKTHYSEDCLLVNLLGSTESSVSLQR